MKTLTLIVLCSSLIALGCSRKPASPIENVDLEVLLSRMTNLNTFAQQPLGDSYLESSYDRTGGNQDWAIWTHPEPTGRITLLDVEGPGYISRIWVASIDVKKWHIFIDEEETARIELPVNGIFGESVPFVAPLAGLSSGGRYSLVPIPFSKRIRIEIEPNNLKASNRNYYHINYTLLHVAPDAVESYPKELTESQKQLVEAVNSFHSNMRPIQTALVAESMKPAVSKQIPAGGSTAIWEDEGAGLLKDFFVRIDSPDASTVMQENLLRALRLQMFWDGNNTPSVDVPLGDFFCNPFYTRTFSAMPIGRVENTFFSRFPMPYKKGANVRLLNMSGAPVTVTTAANGNRDNTEGLNRRFHAVWRASTTSREPFKLMEAEGAGHYVGLFLTAIGQDGSWNILEGDEILRPDPKRLPPQVGTGLEDYFSGAYYYTSLFDLPFHGLIEKGAMRTDQYRFHMLEGVAFQDSFSSDIEFGHGNLSQGYMSGISYWYAEKAKPVPLDNALVPLLGRPNDRFEVHGMMSLFFLLEREGLFQDAADRMAFFAKRYQSQPWSDVLKVRSLGYRELVEGFEAVKKEYESLTQSPYQPAAKAAQDRLWLAADESHALLGIHALAKYRLLLNGQEVAQGEGKGDLRVQRLAIQDGNYTWTVELEPNHQGSFFSLCLRTQDGDITSAGEWQTIALTEQPGQAPPQQFKGGAVLPNMTIWAFQPNAWVNMQSPAMGIQLWSFWAAQPNIQQVTLQRKWSLESATKDLPTEEEERSEEALRMHAVD